MIISVDKKKNWLTDILLLLSLTCTAQVNIWEGTATKRVEMTPYVIDDGQRHAGIIVCPGGSYFWHDMEAEGREVAEWLNGEGINAFVLRYRTAYVPSFLFHYRLLFRGNRYPDPQDDLRQALRYVRRHADAWGVDTLRLGAMGFSAGGHLVLSAAELFPKAERPSFVCALYPVVTMREPYVHRRSRRALLGDDHRHNRRLQDSLSLERHVPRDCPPVFLANCEDDPIVDYHNSLLLDSALTARGVQHRYILYKKGGHGFGASATKGTAEARSWKASFLQWLRGIAVGQNKTNQTTRQ